MHTLVHHARREILLTHPFMIVGQIQVALVVETKLALCTDRKSDDKYSFTNKKVGKYPRLTKDLYLVRSNGEREITAYLISRPQSMHRAYLMRRQCFAE